jgi:hypothetical protein
MSPALGVISIVITSKVIISKFIISIVLVSLGTNKLDRLSRASLLRPD